MATRKNLKKSQQLQEIAIKEYRNNFFRKMKLFMNTYCGEDIYSLIPQDTFERFYFARARSFEYVIENGYEVPKQILNEAKKKLPEILQNEESNILIKERSISINDYYSVCMTVFYMLCKMKATDFKDATKVMTTLNAFLMDEVLKKQVDELLYTVLLAIGAEQSDIRTVVYCFRFYWQQHERQKFGIQNIISINNFKPETRIIALDNNKRTIYKVFWAFPNGGIEYAKLKPKALNTIQIKTDAPKEVYIQTHALNRLAERIDSLPWGLVQAFMHISIRDAKMIIKHNNNLLIEFYFYEYKLGYFVVDIEDEVIVIRTFLFLTNGGTPEGQKLDKNTGLQKLDKNYLGIDKLSTFMASDISSNPEIRNIFDEAGCSILIDVYEKIKEFSLKHSSIDKLLNIIDYIGYKETESFTDFFDKL
jgi:hypothetical protein